jgi:hypothetical protein
MFEDRKIRSSLIWDESRLNNTRTCVAWLSPNRWTNGSLYGNINFHFDWRDLVAGKRFYWVEAIKSYRPPAFRILITAKDPGSGLQLYPIEDASGPLFYDSKKDLWYRNGDFTGEFMVDEDLSLHDCKTVDSGNHNESICRKDGAACSDRKLTWNKAGARLLSRLIGQNVIKPGNSLNRLFLDGEEFHSNARSAISEMVYRCSKPETSGSVTQDDRAGMNLATALLDRYGTERKLDALASLFATPKDLEMAVRRRVAKAFDIPLENVPGSADDF